MLPAEWPLSRSATDTIERLSSNLRKRHPRGITSKSRHIIFDPLDRKPNVFEAGIVFRKSSAVREAKNIQPLHIIVNDSQQSLPR